MGVIENMKEVADLVKDLGNIELNRKIVNLEKEVHELTRDKIHLETKLHEAEQLFKKKQDLKFNELFYYEDGDNVPHCPACWSANSIAVHLHFGFESEDVIRWDCPHCNHTYLVKKNRALQRTPASFGQGGEGGPQGWMR